MKTKAIIILSTFIFSMFLYSCDKMLLGPTEENNARNNYDYVWKDIKEKCGLFATNNLDWDELYHVYGDHLTENSTDAELYEALKGLLSELDNAHVNLIPTDPAYPFFQGGIPGKLQQTFNDFNLEIVKQNYLTGIVNKNYEFIHGQLPNNIAYIHLSHVDAGKKDTKKFFNEVFDKYKDSDGMIIDLRNNKGGMDNQAVYIAGRFSDETKTAFRFRLKDGPGPDDYSQFYEYTIKPGGGGDSQYLKQVVVLTHRFTLSSGEILTMSLKRLGHVTTIGDTTSGAFSDMVIREMPNGWVYTNAIGDWRDYQYNSFEGIGLAPDIVVINNPDDIDAGIDEVLETAIDYLK